MQKKGDKMEKELESVFLRIFQGKIKKILWKKNEKCFSL